MPDTVFARLRGGPASELVAQPFVIVVHRRRLAATVADRRTLGTQEH
jgi:hypothetical protein